jgi:hypothetical protein
MAWNNAFKALVTCAPTLGQSEVTHGILRCDR